MDTHGQQWVLMDSNGQQQIAMDTHGYSWIAMGTHGQQWIAMDSNVTEQKEVEDREYPYKKDMTEYSPCTIHNVPTH